jgi:membrane protein
MLRFPVIALIGFSALFALYALAQDGAIHPRDIWPGTLAALVGWLSVSWLYTLYVNRIARYSLLYGSLGTMMVLLIWLNLSAMALILGAELNGTLISLRKERLSGETPL